MELKKHSSRVALTLLAPSNLRLEAQGDHCGLMSLPPLCPHHPRLSSTLLGRDGIVVESRIRTIARK